jgi:hypothetical protein
VAHSQSRRNSSKNPIVAFVIAGSRAKPSDSQNALKRNVDIDGGLRLGHGRKSNAGFAGDPEHFAGVNHRTGRAQNTVLRAPLKLR